MENGLLPDRQLSPWRKFTKSLDFRIVPVEAFAGFRNYIKNPKGVLVEGLASSRQKSLSILREFEL